MVAAVAKSSGIHVYFHLAAMGDFYREVAAEMIGQVEGSGLYDAADSLTCVTVGHAATRYIFPPRWRVRHGGTIDRYEYPTLERLHEDCIKTYDDEMVLYIHSKGVSSPDGRRYRTQWRRLMMWHCVTQWRRCVELLRNYDTCGAFYMPSPYPHYSGNFWWARARYIKTLPVPSPSSSQMHPRINAEVWPITGSPRAYDLFPTQVALTESYILETYRTTDQGKAVS